ncbi:MAG: class I SAM-dependent methyltransferase [Spirochaetes bacterium]|nr:MAG: class I SAM-dependent methyltransferase [Spirochaetota bacterium]
MNNSDQSRISKRDEKLVRILDGLHDPGKRALVEKFWRVTAAAYFSHLEKIAAQVEHENRDPDEASEEFIRASDDMLAECGRIEVLVDDPAAMQALKSLFRERAIPLAAGSQIVKHAFLKPGGYAGDYGIIEIVYENRPLSSGFGRCIDRRFLMDDYARAVRGRKNAMKEFLYEYIGSSTLPRIEILNLACGSSREILELFRDSPPQFTGQAAFTLVDRDPDALAFSRKALAGLPANITFEFLNHSAYEYIKDPDQCGTELRGKDLVYSIGLADYLPDDILRQLIHFLFDLLNEGGKLVIAHKDSRNYRPLAPDWWCDWTFHLRDEAGVRALIEASGVQASRVSVIREEETNIILFFVLERSGK